jgi:hypothetical protein
LCLLCYRRWRHHYLHLLSESVFPCLRRSEICIVIASSCIRDGNVSFSVSVIFESYRHCISFVCFGISILKLYYYYEDKEGTVIPVSERRDIFFSSFISVTKISKMTYLCVRVCQWMIISCFNGNLCCSLNKITPDQQWIRWTRVCGEKGYNRY